MATVAVPIMAREKATTSNQRSITKWALMRALTTMVDEMVRAKVATGNSMVKVKDMVIIDSMVKGKEKPTLVVEAMVKVKVRCGSDKVSSVFSSNKRFLLFISNIIQGVHDKSAHFGHFIR
jgi:hypothetical protein